MSNDEQEIRQVVANWMAATKRGDIDAVMSLMTDDAVFLVPGGMMRKADFAAQARMLAGQAMQFDGTSDVQEVQVAGDWASMWTRLTVTVKPAGGAPVERAGYTLTIFRRENGRWLLARDANLLATVAK